MEINLIIKWCNKKVQRTGLVHRTTFVQHPFRKSGQGLARAGQRLSSCFHCSRKQIRKQKTMTSNIECTQFNLAMELLIENDLEGIAETAGLLMNTATARTCCRQWSSEDDTREEEKRKVHFMEPTPQPSDPIKRHTWRDLTISACYPTSYQKEANTKSPGMLR